MIIKSVYIGQFGCIENRRIDFEDGLNVISMPNESGKSTIAEFIRVMLYGVNSLRFNQRKQYMPFERSVMGGEMTVECGGTEYTIVRSFGMRKSDDKIDVYNKLTSERIDEYCVESPGEVLCGISGDTFDNTCYIKQLSSKINEEKSGEIQSRLINLSQSGNEDYSYRNAVGILDSEIRELSKPRGKINQTQTKINEIVMRKSEKAKIKEEFEKCSSELEKLNRRRPDGEISIFFLALTYVPALISLIMAVTLKAVWIFAALFAVFAALSVFLTVKRSRNSSARLEHARQVGFLESRIESLKSESERIDISELDMYTKKLKKYNTALSDLKYAKTKLTEAFEEMQKDYVPRLNANASGILKKITGGKYTEFYVDNKYNITLRDSDNRIVQSDYLSKGTYDQIYFSLRMALIGMIAEGMPVILDDSFAMYDDKRLNEAVKYMKTIKNQIIIFSCQSREKNIPAVDFEH